MEKILSFIHEIGDRYNRHHITAYSAQMAYFFVLSVFPLTIFIFMIGDRLDILTTMQESELFFTVPYDIRNLLVGFTQQIDVDSSTAVLSFSGLGALYAASRAVLALQRAMNAVYEIDETRPFILTKLWGMLYTFLFVIVIIVTLMLPNFAEDIIAMLPTFTTSGLNLDFINWWQMIRYIILGGVYILLFGSIYSILPNEKIRLRDAYYGAIFAFLASMGENVVFATVVTRVTNYTVLYGSLSVVIVFMLWLYFLGIIIMIGAEINAYVWAKKPKNIIEASDGNVG